MTSTITRVQRTGGFTLLELLVALLVFSIMSTMAYGGLHAVLAGRDRTAEASAQLVDLQNALGGIERDLLQALPRGVRDPLGAPLAPFAGGSGHDNLLELTTAGNVDPLRPGSIDPQRVDYRLNGDVLGRRRWPVLDRSQGSKADTVALLSGVESVHLRFLDKTMWNDTWPSLRGNAGLLPRAVELTLTLHDGRSYRRVMPTPAG